MYKKRFISFRKKLLAAFGGLGVLVFVMLLLGNHIAGLSIKQFTHVIKNQVQALAAANELHLRIGGIRISEVNIPKLDDYFAVITEVELLNRQIEQFNQELEQFGRQEGLENTQALRSIRNSWDGYKKDLAKVMTLASAMEMSEASRISTASSEPQFKNIQLLLTSTTHILEQSVESVYLQTENEQQQLRGSFTFISVLGLSVGIVLVVLFSRSLSSRVTSLRDAAQRVAEGKVHTPIRIGGRDELTSLADAFNAMQQQIRSRERALTEAHDNLELRVDKRTRDLKQSNQQLQREVTERRRAENSLRLLSQAMEQSSIGVFIANTRGFIEYANIAFTNSTFTKRDTLIGENFRTLMQDIVPESVASELLDVISKGNEWRGEVESHCTTGSPEWMSIVVTPIKDDKQDIAYFMAIREDITLRKRQEAKITRQAQFDGLTDLPNRALAMDRLSQSMMAAERTKSKVVLIFLDLDDFKKINDSLGHDVGDKLLVEAGQRLLGSVRKNDTVARQGGDEFLVILSGLEKGQSAEAIVESILKAFNRPFIIDDHDLLVTPSIGLAVFPDDGSETGELLRNADLAMYQAKDAGRNTFQYYNHIIHDHSLYRLRLERELRHALDRNEMELYYQPLIDINTRSLIGAEVLMRWNSKALGQVSPNNFIGIAEQTGLIVQLGEWAMHQACQQACLWQNMLPEFLLSINVSPRQFRGGFITGTIKRSLEQSHFPPDQLQIEVTEGLLIRNQPEVHGSLTLLDEMGVRLAMDDFGTGYSSLSYLKNYPFHTLKIDRSFINDMTDKSSYLSIVSAAISMGKALGLSLVAEGVETEEQLAILAAEGCHTAQGFLFGKPVPAAVFSDVWMEDDLLDDDQVGNYEVADYP
jgi:diguanylate cyclase (GGDEF)-like protein/PAS domain S-box-containing protein